MKAGDAVRVRVPGRHRLLRGVVLGAVTGCFVGRGLGWWRVRVGLREVAAPREAIQVIRRPTEALLVRAHDQALRAEVRFLAGALQGRRGAI